MLGKKIRDLREAAGLTQGDLAERIGSVQGEISKFENGRQRPAPATVARLAEALGVHGAEFYGPIGGSRPEAVSGGALNPDYARHGLDVKGREALGSVAQRLFDSFMMQSVFGFLPKEALQPTADLLLKAAQVVGGLATTEGDVEMAEAVAVNRLTDAIAVVVMARSELGVSEEKATAFAPESRDVHAQLLAQPVQPQTQDQESDTPKRRRRKK